MTLPDRCKKCFAVLPPDAKFCPRCGEAVPDPEVTVRDGLQVCPSCKHVNPASAVFCESCGSRLREGAVTPAAGTGQATDTPGVATPPDSRQAEEPGPAPAEEIRPPSAADGYLIVGTIPGTAPSSQQPQPSATEYRPQPGNEDPWAVTPAAPTYRPAMPEAKCPRCGTFKPANATQCTNCGLPFEQVSEDGIPFDVMEQGFPAGFWVRFVAIIIDAIIVFAIGAGVWPLIFQEAFWYQATLVSDDGTVTTVWTTRSWHSLIWVCYEIFFLALWGTTGGKRLLNIYVLNRSGRSRIGFLRAFIRTLATYLSLLLLLIGFIMVAFRRDKRALHDLIADTYPTVRTRR